MTMVEERAAHDLLRKLERLPEFDGYKIELIDGTICMHPSAKPFHNFIQSYVTGAFINHGWWSLTEQALISSVVGYEPKPDVVVTTAEQAADNANPYPADRVEMAAEIVSTDRDSDYGKKRIWCAMSGIPLYLLIDPNDGTCQLHSEPDRASYRVVRHSLFGEPIVLPKPFGFDVETTRFKVYPPSA